MPDQSTFHAGLLNAEADVPDGLIDGSGAGAGRRYNVYRNNIAVSLTEALQVSFPVLRKLIGTQNFDNLAGLYLRAHPPQSPLIMQYGHKMAEFLEGFEPLAHIGYLPDVARLEQALRQSYHAQDASPLDPTELSTIAPDALPQAKLHFAPAVQLIPSIWPLFSIWRFNTEDGAPKPESRPEPVLITRPEFDPTPHALDPTGFLCAQALGNGATIAQAIAATDDPEFDFAALLTLLLSHGALTHIST